MTEKTNDATALLQALVAAMEQSLVASKRDDSAECEAIFKQLQQPGGFRSRLIAWRKRRDTVSGDDGKGEADAGANLRPRRKR